MSSHSRPIAENSGETVHNALDMILPPRSVADLPLRIPIESIEKDGGRDIIVGWIASGHLRAGDTVLFSPANLTAIVETIGDPAAGGSVAEAGTGSTVRLGLDRHLDIGPGEVASHTDAPPVETSVFRARLVWLGAKPLSVGAELSVRLNGLETAAKVESLEPVGEVPGLKDVGDGAVADVVLRAPQMLVLDSAEDNPVTGRFDLLELGKIIGGGLIGMEGYPDQRGLVTQRATNITAVEHRVSGQARAERLGHAGGVLWLTGLSGSGKSTLAIELEQQLFQLGYQVYVLDGDNVRHGLNSNLGFSPEDRAENIRRIGEVAALFADAGVLVITAFISPYRADRDRSRETVGPDNFHEVYIKADLATCERRDPKGLYKKARAGEILEFTGISAPYEAPEACELVVDTVNLDISDSARTILNYVERRFKL